MCTVDRRVRSEPSPEFLRARSGDFVVIQEDLPFPANGKSDWWVGQILHVVGGSRKSSYNSIFQVANIDTGQIKDINADLVVGILFSNE
tara:strand:+ start:213 stop:479 length:267 start_codon:yes stop_codon:yes gene_type:complete